MPNLMPQDFAVPTMASKPGAGGRGVARSTRCGARVKTPGGDAPGLRLRREVQPPEGCLGHSVPHAQRSARAFETQTAAALSSSRMFPNIHSMFINLQGAISRSRPAWPLLGSRQQSRISMFSLSLSRRQGTGCTAAQAKPSRHDKTIVVQPCSHPMPSPDLEKVRKNGIFVVFLRKEKTKKLRSYFAKSLLIPQPQLQANAVLSKTAKCRARESNALASAES